MYYFNFFLGVACLYLFLLKEVETVRDTVCWAEFSKTEALAFLSNGKRSTPKECCDESRCESRGTLCNTEQYRTFIARTHPITCPAGQIMKVTSWCPGHYRTECSDPCKSLSREQCENGGTCVSAAGGNWSCYCQPGYAGTICQDIDYCLSNPCNSLYSERCQNRPGHYQCDCKSGYSGVDCDMDIDECASTPCQNDSTCNDHVNGYTCNCTAGYTGVNCQTVFNETSPEPTTDINCFDQDKTCAERGINFCQNLEEAYFMCRLYCDLCNYVYTTPEATTLGVTKTPAPRCNLSAEVVFVLDASSSVGAVNFQIIRTFTENVTERLNTEYQILNVTLITFSNEAQLELSITLSEPGDLAEMLSALSNITYTHGGTETHKALDLMQQTFNYDTNSPKIAIVVTNGASFEPDLTKQSAQNAKDNNVSIFVIGIGDEINQHETAAISSDPDDRYLYQLSNFNGLQSIVDEFYSHEQAVCQEITPSTQSSTPAPTTPIVTESTTVMTTTTTPELTTTSSCIAKIADVVFVVDASGSIGQDNFDKVKQFIKEVIKTFDVGYTRVALIEYSSLANIEFKLNEKTNLTDLLDAVDHVNYSGGGTATSDALQLMRLHGFDSERPLAPRVAVVITDGLSRYPPITKIKASLAKQDGITVFSIGIGNAVVRSELEAIASSDKYVYEVGSYDLLISLESVVAHNACGVALPGFYQNRSTAVPTAVQMGCFDLDDNCDSYHQDSCTDFEPYARAHCAKKCGYCTGEPVAAAPCEDTINNCASYGDYVCYTASQYDWVEAHCMKSCGFCGNKTEVKLTTPATTQVTDVMTTLATCEDKRANCHEYGGQALCTGSTEIFARINCAKYCHYCYTYINVTPPTVNNLGCPSWTLPEECTLEYLPGQCCPFPKCPHNFRLTVRRRLS